MYLGPTINSPFIDDEDVLLQDQTSWSRACIKSKEVQNICAGIHKDTDFFSLNPNPFRVTKPAQSLSPLTCKKTTLELKPAEHPLYPPGDVCYKQKENEIVHSKKPIIFGGLAWGWEPF